jgi:uncharacterized protein with HEPN domain
MAGLRDKVIHDYDGINMPLIWAVVEKEIPLVKPKIAAIMEELGEPEKG